MLFQPLFRLKTLLVFCISFNFFVPIVAQRDRSQFYIDSTKNWNFHFQFTSIWQMHPSFHASYTGTNSLRPQKEEALSVTSTTYFGRRLWKGASLYFNPEIAGGKGFSSATGVAGFTNGECFRIGNPEPALYTARLFIRQNINLSDPAKEKEENSVNVLPENLASSRITLTAGKYSIADIFDANDFSHDPRTQFMNWALMGNGAWDYPANTRGYSYSFTAELIQPSWALRMGISSVPKVANGPDLEFNFKKAAGYTLELEKKYSILFNVGHIRLLLFHNRSNAGNYRDAINNYLAGTDLSLTVDSFRNHHGMKTGFGINMDQQIGRDLGFFAKASWNDGKSATWAFTEIDRSISSGLTTNGSKWFRPADQVGIAIAVNGISRDHRDFLNTGGYGFIIGDGKLPHYRTEQIVETYYNAAISSTFSLSVGYQYIMNPAYNADRGPVHVFSVRGHYEF
jgi:high affinity Mn2+ porin